MTDGSGLAGRLAATFINSRLTPLLILASLTLGLFAVIALPREEEPQIVVPMIDVFVQMPGASPTEIEQRIARPLERLLWEVPGVGIRGLEKQGRNALIVTRHVGSSFSKSLILEDGSVVGDGVDEKIEENFRSYLNERRPIIADGAIIEPVLSASLLYLFGAGHVSQYVSKIAAIVDFNVVVIDDRDDFANPERFPEAHEIIVEDFHKVFDRVNFFGNEYVAILTRGHKYDALVLEEVLKRPTHYIGMIGSKRKTRMVIDHLKKKGFDESALKSVHAPIGVDIQSETPQEIAVSIVAELIKIKRKA